MKIKLNSNLFPVQKLKGQGNLGVSYNSKPIYLT